MTIELPALRGTNPLGLFAALGALDVADRHAKQSGGEPPKLWWSDAIDPEARIEGIDSVDALIELIDADRTRWVDSPVLDQVNDTLKLETKSINSPSPLRKWVQSVCDGGEETDMSMLYALVAEGATLGSSTESKPTHFDFTAGQQKFLVMVRELRDKVTADDFREAIVGPWRFESPLPSLSWDTSRGARIFALRGFNPATEKKLSVAGAEWLGFLGLRFFPVATQTVGTRAQLITTGCEPNWKRSAFVWVLWNRPLTPSVIQSLLADKTVPTFSERERAALGVSRILRAPITRTDQGGYGSFGPAAETISVRDRVDAMIL